MEEIVNARWKQMFPILNRVTKKVLYKKAAVEPRFKSSEGINPAFMQQRSQDGNISGVYDDQQGQWGWNVTETCKILTRILLWMIWRINYKG